MMGMRLPLGIEKGKDFKPDVATVARLNSAAAEAHAWLLAQIPTFVADWWPGPARAQSIRILMIPSKQRDWITSSNG